MSGKSKVAIRPNHPAWSVFHAELGRRLQVDPLLQKGCVCDHRGTMPHTIQALSAIGLAQRNVLRTRELFRAYGLTCDCAVWKNPDQLLRELEEYQPEWIDADGNYDPDAFYWAEIREYD